MAGGIGERTTSLLGKRRRVKEYRVLVNHDSIHLDGLDFRLERANLRPHMVYPRPERAYYKLETVDL